MLDTNGDVRHEAPEEELLDVYRCYDPQLADRVVELLQEAGIDALLRDHASSAFPTTIGTTAELVVAVPQGAVATARAAIATAEEDGILPAGQASLA